MDFSRKKTGTPCYGYQWNFPEYMLKIEKNVDFQPGIEWKSFRNSKGEIMLISIGNQDGQFSGKVHHVFLLLKYDICTLYFF